MTTLNNIIQFAVYAVEFAIIGICVLATAVVLWHTVARGVARLKKN